NRPTPGEIRSLAQDDYAKARSRFPGHVGEIGEVVEREDAFQVSVVLEDAGGRARVAVYSEPKVPWDSWSSEVEETLPAREVEAVASETLTSPVGDERPGDAGSPLAVDPLSALACAADDTWDNGILDDLPYPINLPSAVWTGALMIVWGGT